jgi:hypothetical protein
MPAIYTAGYSRLRDPDRLLALAGDLDAIVIDVRLKPYTSFKGWSREALEALLGQRYRWVEAFGNEAYQEGGLRLHDPQAGLAQGAPILAECSVILLCGCADPAECHRTAVAVLLAEATGCPVSHLEPPDSGDSAGPESADQPTQLPLW